MSFLKYVLLVVSSKGLHSASNFKEVYVLKSN
jgi:hypothetical protein